MFEGRTGFITALVFSPDGRRALSGGGDRQMHLWDVASRTLIRSFNGHEKPVWSVAFTPDGAHLLVVENYRDIAVVNVAQPVRLEPLLHSDASEQLAEVSPDGKWIAYTAWDQGHAEVYLSRFPNPGTRTQVSVTGAWYPRWSRRGDEIFYVTNEGIMAVPVRMSPEVTIGTPRRILDRRPMDYDVLPAGGLVATLPDTTWNANARIDVVVGWFPELRERLKRAQK